MQKELRPQGRLFGRENGLFICETVACRSANPLLVCIKNDIPKAVYVLSVGALFCYFAQMASSPLFASIFGPTAL